MAASSLACQGAFGLADAMSRKDEERAQRLAEALRENLRRRKAQAREQAGAPKAEDKTR